MIHSGITDSIPTMSDRLSGHEPFKILSLCYSMISSLLERYTIDTSNLSLAVWMCFDDSQFISGTEAAFHKLFPEITFGFSSKYIATHIPEQLTSYSMSKERALERLKKSLNVLIVTTAFFIAIEPVIDPITLDYYHLILIRMNTYNIIETKTESVRLDPVVWASWSQNVQDPLQKYYSRFKNWKYL